MSPLHGTPHHGPWMNLPYLLVEPVLASSYPLAVKPSGLISSLLAAQAYSWEGCLRVAQQRLLCGNDRSKQQPDNEEKRPGGSCILPGVATCFLSQYCTHVKIILYGLPSP